MVTAHEFTEAKPSYVKTLEGKVKVKQGDMVITGIGSENYPCSAEDFKALYEHIEDDKYRKREIVVDAIMLLCNMTIENDEMTMKGECGDWLVSDSFGRQYICDAGVFMHTYDEVDD